MVFRAIPVPRFPFHCHPALCRFHSPSASVRTAALIDLQLLVRRSVSGGLRARQSSTALSGLRSSLFPHYPPPPLLVLAAVLSKLQRA